MACERLARGGKIDKLDYITVARDAIVRFGSIAETPGDTPLPQANDELHRELQWPPDKLRQLAEALFDQQQAVTRIAKSAVRKLLLELAPGAVSSTNVQATLAAERERSKDDK